MEKKLIELKKLFKGDFYLSSDGNVINSNLCTLSPQHLRAIADLGLVLDSFSIGLFTRLRFFNAD